jgi:hypothetical protein
MNLVERLKDQTISLITQDENGTVIANQQVRIGNSKGFLLVKVGDDHYAPTVQELTEVQDVFEKMLHQCDEKVPLLVTSHHLDVKYVRFD